MFAPLTSLLAGSGELVSSEQRGRSLAIPFRVVLAFSLLLVFMQYVGMMNMQSQSFDVVLALGQMREKGLIQELGPWTVTYSRCEGSVSPRRCEAVSGGLEQETVRFPDPTGIEKRVAGDRRINHADLVYDFSADDGIWLKKRRDAVLILPRSVQKSIQVSFGGQSLEVTNTGSVVLPLDLRNRTSGSSLLVSVDFDGRSFFGPGELPVVMANPGRATDDFLTLEKRINFGKEIASRMEIGFPLLLAAVAIVLDHSVSFGLLSLFAMAFATRSYIAFSVSHGAPWNAFVNVGYVAANGLAAGFLALFCLSMAGLLPRKIVWRVSILLMTVLLAFAFVWLVPDGLFRLDLVFDAGACSVGMVAISLGLVVFFVRRRMAKEARVEVGFFEVNPLLKSGQVAGLLLILAIHAYVNLFELFGSAKVVEKNFLDWRHSVLFPGLLAAALVEMGSVTRKIHRVAQREAQRAVLEREMAMGRAVQERMLGSRRTSGSGWLARAFFAPAVELAGDWYHVHEIGYSDGNRLVAAILADVTGHGVSAALVTSVLRSQWGQWMNAAALRAAPYTDEERERELDSLLGCLDFGVRSLGHSDVATAAVVLLSPSTGRFSYCTAAHPSMLRVVAGDAGGSELKTMRTPSPQVGAIDETDVRGGSSWKCKSDILNKEEYLCIYSDGLGAVLAGEGKSLVRELQRRQKELGQRFDRVLLERMRLVRRFYRANRDLEDDITLLLLWRKGEKS
jgi:serine phosphatase RsbU (regulator of sigma subunit)